MSKRRINLLDLATGDEAHVEEETKSSFRVWLGAMGKAGIDCYETFSVVDFLKRFRIITITDIKESPIIITSQTEVKLWEIENAEEIVTYMKEFKTDTDPRELLENYYDLHTYELKDGTNKRFRVTWKRSI